MEAMHLKIWSAVLTWYFLDDLAKIPQRLCEHYSLYQILLLVKEVSIMKTIINENERGYLFKYGKFI